ncbi:unnamed protein product [Adineta ricciae]|uniref:Amidohydrolase-related domain-containing protein n=1 Tax=Adineta ricciae TaxID=249248 RepID=A0A815Y3K6_ADIRI|nr:unnamed protein product [Adineta ricciae]
MGVEHSHNENCSDRDHGSSSESDGIEHRHSINQTTEENSPAKCEKTETNTTDDIGLESKFGMLDILLSSAEVTFQIHPADINRQRLPLTYIEGSDEYKIVWLHDEKLDKTVKEQTRTELTVLFKQIYIFDNVESCLDFLYTLDTNFDRLFIISNLSFDDKFIGPTSPLIDDEHPISTILRRFKYEHHIHHHILDLLSTNYVHYIGERFLNGKVQDENKINSTLDIDPSCYQIGFLKSSLSLSKVNSDVLIDGLRSVFDSLIIFENQSECLKYLISIKATAVTIYLIVYDLEDIEKFQEITNVKKIYQINSEETDKLILRVRNDVRAETSGPIHLLEKSVQYINEKYTPYISLMANLDLYLTLTRNTHDRERMKQEMITECQCIYHDNAQQLERIEEFDKNYDAQKEGKAIHWYTRDSFLYRLINRVLRTGDPDLIYPYRFFINELNDEITNMDRHYCNEVEDLIVYRGQGLSHSELHYLQYKTNQLLALSSFTSTTVDREMALGYAISSANDQVVPVLFEFHLHPTINNTRPYAYVAEHSAVPNEYEVLLTYGIIFRLVSVIYDCNQNVWIIVGHLLRLQNHDIKNLLSKRSENKFRWNTFDADTCHYHKKKRELSTRHSNNTNDNIPAMTADDLPSVFDFFDADETDDGVHPVLLSYTLEQRKSIALIGTLLLADESIKNGTLVIVNDRIAALGTEIRIPDDAFILHTDGIIFPGLIDLHNHMTWNIFPRWKPSEEFGSRYDWQQKSIYKTLLSSPHKGLVEAGLSCEMQRYAEVKAITQGTTSIIGSLRRPCNQGLVRNLDDEVTLGRILYNVFPLQMTELEMEEVKDVLSSNGSLFIHLAEGAPNDATAAREFSMLKARGLLVPGVSLIHGVALKKNEFRTMANTTVGLVWSPRSNLELYGDTTNLQAALESHVITAIAPDWSPTGSDGLLSELNYAATWNGGLDQSLFDDRLLLKMATVNPAKLTHLDTRLGQLKEGYLADIVVLKDQNNIQSSKDPYWAATHAKPEDVSLVIIGGEPVYGDPDIMKQLIDVQDLELLNICGTNKSISFASQFGSEFSFYHTQKLLNTALRHWSRTLAPLSECGN